MNTLLQRKKFLKNLMQILQELLDVININT